MLNMLALYMTIQLLPSVKLKGGFFSVGFMVVIIAILNWGLRPLLILVSFPIIFLTFGGFLLIINGLIFLISAKIIKSIEIEDLPAAVLTWGVYSLISFTLNYPF